MQGMVLGMSFGKIGCYRVVVAGGVDQRGQVMALRVKIGWALTQ